MSLNRKIYGHVRLPRNKRHKLIHNDRQRDKREWADEIANYNINADYRNRKGSDETVQQRNLPHNA